MLLEEGSAFELPNKLQPQGSPSSLLALPEPLLPQLELLATLPLQPPKVQL